MKHLRHSQIAQIDRKLELQERELRDEIRKALLQSDQQHHRDLAGMVGDAGDESVANMVADLDAAFLDRHVHELRELEAARGRLKSGTYGVCVDCGEPIAWQRLLAYPVSTRCTACEAQHDKTHAHASTPTL